MFRTQIQLTEKQARELKALAATGKFHSGHSDLAEEHDPHLAEAIENRGDRSDRYLRRQDSREHPMEDPQGHAARLIAYSKGRDPVAMQAETAGVLADLIAGIPDAALRQRPRSDKWSVGEILAHLAEDELATGWRYRQMIEHDPCPLPSFDQDLWARLGDYGSWDPAAALDLFRLLREANLRLLRRLTPEQWHRQGIHAERGPLSIADLARHMAGHDRNHLDQIRERLEGNDKAPAPETSPPGA